MDGHLLLVHAHPDDESIFTGLTMARAVARGSRVTLVTCTQGELGEVVVPELAHLAADRDDMLGPHRAGELDTATAILGVQDVRFLGGPGRYRDSGMVWAADGVAAPPPDPAPESFWLVDVEIAAAELAAILDEVRPDAVITYDDFGFYGHPDHIQANRVTGRAVAMAAEHPQLWWITTADDAGCTVSAPEFLERKMAAMRAHVSQIDDAFIATMEDPGSEYFRVVRR